MNPIPWSLFPTFLTAFSLLTFTTAHAQVPAVSNLTNSVSGSAVVLDIPSPFSSIGQDEAQPFTTGPSSQTLSGVTLEMTSTGAGGALVNDGGGFTVGLHGDSGGAPGALLSLLSGDSTPTTSGLYTFTDPLSTILSASTPYWIVASVPHDGSVFSQYFWNTTADLSETGLPGWSLGFTSTRAVPSGIPDPWISSTFEALKMEADILPVPETSTWVAGAAVALMAGSVYLRRTRR